MFKRFEIFLSADRGLSCVAKLNNGMASSKGKPEENASRQEFAFYEFT